MRPGCYNRAGLVHLSQCCALRSALRSVPQLWYESVICQERKQGLHLFTLANITWRKFIFFPTIVDYFTHIHTQACMHTCIFVGEVLEWWMLPEHTRAQWLAQGNLDSALEVKLAPLQLPVLPIHFGLCWTWTGDPLVPKPSPSSLSYCRPKCGSRIQNMSGLIEPTPGNDCEAQCAENVSGWEQQDWWFWILIWRAWNTNFILLPVWLPIWL